MHLRSGKILDTELEIEREPEQYNTFIVDDFNILMDILHKRILEISTLKNNKCANQSELEIILMNQIRILTEIYYLFSHYSHLIFTYIDIDNANAEYAKSIVLAALSRINVVFNQLMRYEFIEKYKFVRILDPLYHEWEECIRIFGILYEKK